MLSFQEQGNHMEAYMQDETADIKKLHSENLSGAHIMNK